MRILLPTDGSEGATAAARTACRILRGEDRQMDLLCVAPEYGRRMTGWDESRAGKLYRQRILAEAQRILGEAKAAFGTEEVEIRTRSEAGSPQGVILRASGGL